jgi:hypothetical protein
MDPDKTNAIIDELKDIGILFGWCFMLVMLVVVTSLFADWLWWVMGNVLMIQSPVAPAFVIAAGIGIDIWISISVLTRVINGRWPWSP